MQTGAALLEDVRRLFADDGFAISMLVVVVVAAILAFGFGARSDVVAPLLVLGIVTALAERKLRAKK